MLSELWLRYTSEIDSDDGLTTLIMTTMRKAIKDSRDRLLKLTAFTALFRLLEQFSMEKNKSAPQIYRVLVFHSVESINDTTVREMCWLLFTQLFSKVSTIPIDLLVEPLVKRL